MGIYNNKEKSDMERMDLLQHFVPTSKIQLKHMCMWYTGGDIEKATQMFEYYIGGLNLPDVEPEPPSIMKQVKDNSLGFFNWCKENQGDLVNGIQTIVSMIKNKGILPVAEETVKEAEELQPIN